MAFLKERKRRIPLNRRFQLTHYSKKFQFSLFSVEVGLAEKETSFLHLLVARKTVEDYDLPLSYYVDEHSIFRFVKHKGIHATYTVGNDEGKIQFKRALESLGIGVIYAHSPRPHEVAFG